MHRITHGIAWTLDPHVLGIALGDVRTAAPGVPVPVSIRRCVLAMAAAHGVWAWLSAEGRVAAVGAGVCPLDAQDAAAVGLWWALVGGVRWRCEECGEVGRISDPRTSSEPMMKVPFGARLSRA
ncbi:hypothetical protein [Nodularia spumigena]|uniref:hypothetical protein n=1 Tax=Nodularia spumigena TaxID=70799 RepID=UPI002B20F0CB|nr:hypothetical protein [Nodularia spumigena]MEA5557693.1 hypothetical protein [Nodularia spumigena CH309]